MKEKEINKIATEFLNLRKGCIPRTDMSLKKLLVDFYDYAWEGMTNKAEITPKRNLPKRKKVWTNWGVGLMIPVNRLEEWNQSDKSGKNFIWNHFMK
jgi:hypothetical protein